MQIKNGKNQGTTKNIGKTIRIKRMLWLLIIAFIGFNIVVSVFLYFYQEKMIYHPQKYEGKWDRFFPENIRKIEYTTSQGKQTSFYQIPSENSNESPDQIWIMFNGNASVAYDWIDYFEETDTGRAGLLFVEYPGYGVCEGSPSRKHILEAAEKALETLCKELKMNKDDAEKRLNVYGFSIGTFVAVDFAQKHNLKNLILVAPPTSLLDMAKISVGKVFCHLLKERYDSRVGLKKILASENPPEIYIFHGDADDIVPYKMGEELAAIDEKRIRFIPAPDMDHMNVIYGAKNMIMEIINDKEKNNEEDNDEIAESEPVAQGKTDN